MLLWVFKDNNPQVDLKANFHISVNFFLLSKNITVTALINRHRPDIAAYLGLQDGGNVRREEEREARKLRAETLRMKTEQLAARNAAARQKREQRQQLAPWQRGYRSF